MLRTCSLHVLGFVLGSCTLTPEFPADAAPFEPQVRAFDALAQAMALDHLPRRPRISIALPAAPSATKDGPWLLTGAADDALLDDLEKLPLTAAHQARSVAVQQTWDGKSLQLEPLHALTAGAAYTLALPRKAAMTLPRAFTIELRVDDSPQAGAALRSSFPPAQAAGVPSDLAFALLGFDGEVRGTEAGVWLENSDGLAHPAHAELVDCGSVDTAACSCVRVQPEVALEPGRRYELRSGRELHDAHEAALDELHAAFSTQSEQAAAPDWQQRMCDIDEQALPIGCVLPSDTSVELTLFQNPARRVLARLAGTQLAALPSAGAAPLKFTGLTADSHYTLEIDSIDARLASESLRWELQTAPKLPTLVISEVSADPNGAEPDQEYVELWNFGEEPVALGELCLSDNPRELGGPLPAASLAPSGRALLVSDAYDAADIRDPTPAAGSIIVRLGKSVTHGGLANSGEKLFLRSCAGFRVSSSPAQPAPREGACLVRDTADNWRLSECTPGL